MGIYSAFSETEMFRCW